MDASKTSETKYERIRKIGIGSYGVVFKCVNRQTGQIVAIKRYSENDSDPIIRKIAMREVRMLRQLKHPNLIQLIEVFRRKRILHLVFDYCELTVLDVIEKYGNNCPLNLIRKIIWQLVNGVNHCHSHNCIHRDIKPENILINQAGVVKLCDFGFARNLNSLSSGSNGVKQASLGQREAQLLGVALPQQSGHPVALPVAENNSAMNKENSELLKDRQALTEYVATRWYRAPELLVGDIYYDIKIDIWAIGCVTAELMRGEPLWPGKTDLDQLFLIRNSLGQLTPEQTHNLLTRGLYDQSKLERVLNQTSMLDPLNWKLPARVGQTGMEFVLGCLQMDPNKRPMSDELLQHQYIHSTLMSQFVRAATQGATQSVNSGSEPESYYVGQRSIGQGMITTRPPMAVTSSAATTSSGQNGSLHRSNSQAILRMANSQQPASKRLVLGPAIHEAASGSSAVGGATGGMSGEQPITPSKYPSKGSLIAKPIRSKQPETTTAPTATTMAKHKTDVSGGRQDRHKRKTPRAVASNELPGSQASQLIDSKGKLIKQSKPASDAVPLPVQQTPRRVMRMRAAPSSVAGPSEALLGPSQSSPRRARQPTSSEGSLANAERKSRRSLLDDRDHSVSRFSNQRKLVDAQPMESTSKNRSQMRAVLAGGEQTKAAGGENSASTKSSMSTSSSNSFALRSQHKSSSSTSSFLPPVGRQAGSAAPD